MRERRRPAGWARWRGALAVLAALACAVPALGQESAATLELTPSAKRSLARIQEQWLRWLGESYQDREEEGDETAADILATAQALGAESIPDLGRAAISRALAGAREGNSEAAARAMAAAEVFAPRLPDLQFAHARIAWLEGDRVGAVRFWARGWVEALRTPLIRRLVLLNAALWAVVVILVAGGLFIMLLAATRGARVLLRLTDLIGRSLPRGLAIVIALVVVLWPVALPPNGLWLLPWWSVLLWSHASRSERTVLAVVWVVAAVVPGAVAIHHREIRFELEPTVRALEGIERRELRGGLARDLRAILDELPEAPAVIQLVGDVHRRLGQWDLAARRWRQVLELEPENATAIIDLGAHAFRKGDFGAAIQLFQQATNIDPTSSVAWYDLSQAYSEAYQFDAQRSALEEARRLDRDLVGGWISEPPEDRVVLAEGGVNRIPEVRALLRAHVDERLAGARGLGTQAPLSLAVPAVLLLLAVAIAKPLAPVDKGLPEGFTWRSGMGWRAARVLLPGLPSAEIAEGFATFGALLLPVGIGMVPAASHLAYTLPIACLPDPIGAPIAGVALLVVLAARWLWDLRTEG